MPFLRLYTLLIASLLFAITFCQQVERDHERDHDHAPRVAAHDSPSTTQPVHYSGPGITGAAQLPQSLAKVVFPTDAVRKPFPSGLGLLGLNKLEQWVTNGKSPLGTLDAPTIPPFIGSPSSGSDTYGAPWGDCSVQGTNPYTSSPNTGVVRSYFFSLSRGTLAPDGVEKSVILVNGHFPGPTIKANWGDTIQVTVTNNITGPAEGTAIHWHGLLQTGTEYEDGVPGISQCPIAPGETFTYSFKADLYGTSWWHSHFSAQYAAGAFGAMIIHGPQHTQYEVDLGPVLLTDYYHCDYLSVVKDVMGTDLTKIAPFSQNNLINGKGNYNCSLITDGTPCTPNAGLSKFHVHSGRTYRLRLINAGAEGIQRFSIDNHSLQVIAYDFVPTVPYTTNQITLGIGQRADVLVKATGNSTGAFWMRSTISSQCSLSEQPNALAIVYYENANTTAQPTSKSWPIDDSTCANDDLTKTVPAFAMAPPATSATVKVDLDITINSTGHFLWTMDNSSFRTDYSNPVLPLLQASNSSANINTFPREWNVYNFGSNKTFVIVIQNKFFVAHPMHLHGHNMFVLSQGPGAWDGKIQGNPYNPARRDVQILPPLGYIAIQIIADNPGVWPFHCHIAWHVSGGLYMNILERPAEIRSHVPAPAPWKKLCNSWNYFTSHGFVDQIDSGLKRRSQHGAGLHAAVDKQRMARHLREHLRHTL